MKLEKAFESLLAPRNLTDLSLFIEKAKKEAKSKDAEDTIFDAFVTYLSETGNVNIAINFEEQTIVYREQLFRDTNFYIQPTAYECKEQVIIIGHRLIPFVNPTTPGDQLVFQTANDLVLAQTKQAFPFEDFEIFFRLLPPYESKYFDINIETSQVSLGVLDLKPWLGQTVLKVEDWIEVEPIDYDKGIFSLTLLGSRKKAELGLLLRRKDELLIESVEEILFNYSPVLPVDLTLFWAFSQLPAKTLAIAGSPIGPFLSKQEDYSFYNDGEFTYLQAVDYYESFWEDAIAGEFLPDIDSMGKAEDIDGIFAELGSTFSESVIEGFMVHHLHKHGEIDTTAILESIFRQDIEPFYVEEQEKNFKKALKKLKKQVEKKWDDERLALPVQQLLSKALEFKVEFVNFLREIDDKLTNPEELDFAELLQLQPVDHLIDEIIFLVIGKEAISAKEGKTISNQLSMARDLFRNFKANFLNNL